MNQQAIESKLATLGYLIKFTTFEVNDEDDYTYLAYEYNSQEKELSIREFFSHYNRENIVVDLILLEIDQRCFSISTSVFERYISDEEDIQLIKRMVNQSLGKENIVCSLSKMKDEPTLEVNLLVRENTSHYHDYDLLFIDTEDITIGQIVSEIVSTTNQNWDEK